MNDFWELLELDPTQDVSAIKRAYARKTRTCHPEEDPEGFLQLRGTYQAALDYAEGRPSPDNPEPLPETDGGEAENGDWTISGRPAARGEEQDYEARRSLVLLKGNVGYARLSFDVFRADAPFYFSLYPASAACVDREGGVESLKGGEAERPASKSCWRGSCGRTA